MEWLTVREKKIVSSPVLDLIERDCRASDDGREHRFYVMQSRDWCNVIPVTEDGKIVMVRQFRIGITEPTLEVPGGVTDPEDHDAEATAIREMTEETGYEPLPGARRVPLGWTHPNPAIMDNRCFSFAVGPVRKTRDQKLDAGEGIEVVEVPLERIPGMILNGEITHALMLNAFFLLTLRLAGGPGELLEALRSVSRDRA